MRTRLLLTMLLFCCAASFAQEAGKISRVLPEGFVRRAGATAEAKLADPILWNDIVRTNLQGRVRIGLNDGSLLTVGAKSELRVVKHDTQSRQTLVELLYGGARARVQAITQRGGAFQVRTPTAVIGVIGTEFFVDATPGSDWDPGLKHTSATRPQDQQREQPQSLADIPPGAMPGGAGVSIADFASVDETFVLGIDRVTAVRNVDQTVPGVVFLLPGEYTVVRRGMPPTPPRPASGAPDSPPQWPDALQRASVDGDCFQWLDLSRPLPEGPQAPKVKIVGRGTSTGQVFEVQVENPGDCPVDVFMPHGAVLKPKGYVGRVIKGILLGGNLAPLKDFQMMMTEGGANEFSHRLPTTGGMHFVAPEQSAASFLLRGFCLELHKLPPHERTEYKLADAGDAQKFAAHRELISRAHRMFYERKIAPQLNTLDGVIQWSVWVSREKMDQKDFGKEFMKLVEQNYKAKKAKWDKKAKQEAKAIGDDLWVAVSKVLAEK